MIVLSDNTSTNALINLLGFGLVNQYIKCLGMERTVLRRKMLDEAARAEGRDNFTTAADMLVLFRKLFAYQILTPELCALAIHILGKQRDYGRFMRYIWEDVPLYHKTGGLDYLSHDVGVFNFNGQYIYLGVFLQHTPDINGDHSLIGRVARVVYDHYMKGERQ
jgi:beta-lactamase class A